MRRAASAVVVVLCSGALGLLAAPRAGAHALLVRAQPADGASLSSSPEAVTLEFSEAPDPDLSHIDVIDTSGTMHQRGDPRTVSTDPERVRVGLEALGKGVYTVSWRVVSRVDGHLTAGAYAFGVGVSPSQIQNTKVTSTAAPTLSGAEVAGRVLLSIGLLLLVGGSWIFGFVFSSTPRGARTLMVGGVVLAAAGLVVFALAQQSSAGVSFARLFATPLGRALIGRGVGIAVAASAVAIGSIVARRRRIAWDVAGVAAAATIFVHASAGHAAAGGVVWFKVLEHFAHVTAVGVWVGGLAAVLVGIRSVEPDERLRAVRRFSTVAGVALFVVAGSGTGRAYQEVGSWSGLFSTSYGRIVIGKVTGIAVLTGLGALNRYRNVRRADADPDALKRTSSVELSVAVMVLVLAALLASLAPAKSSQARTPSSVVAEGKDFTGDVTARLEITPGQSGVNEFAVELDVRDGAAVQDVRLRLTPATGDVEPSTVDLKRSNGRWIARGSAVATPGRWRVVLTVDRGADSVEIPLVFHTACPPPTTQDADGLRLHTLDLGGRSVQAYVDPAKAGNNEVHFTLFDAKGKELKLDGEVVVTASRGERVIDLDERKLSPGHVVAGGKLESGDWVFDFQGETKGGEAVNVCFEDVIG
jgi:copper transport protein